MALQWPLAVLLSYLKEGMEKKSVTLQNGVNCTKLLCSLSRGL